MGDGCVCVGSRTSLCDLGESLGSAMTGRCSRCGMSERILRTTRVGEGSSENQVRCKWGVVWNRAADWVVIEIGKHYDNASAT